MLPLFADGQIDLGVLVDLGAGTRVLREDASRRGAGYFSDVADLQTRLHDSCLRLVLLEPDHVRNRDLRGLPLPTGDRQVDERPRGSSRARGRRLRHDTVLLPARGLGDLSDHKIGLANDRFGLAKRLGYEVRHRDHPRNDRPGIYGQRDLSAAGNPGVGGRQL